jgi:metallo-beta-lactamase class B
METDFRVGSGVRDVGSGVGRIGFAAVLALLVSVSGVPLIGQGADDTVQAHVDAAKAAAGQDFPNLFTQLCVVPAQPPAAAAAGQGGARSGAPSVPDRSTWHAEPAKVFDNLYFVGQTEYSAWAVTTSAGIILIDSIYGYSVEDEVAGGLRKLGLDPAQIKYVIVSHGHADHSGGAKYLQETFGAHVILSAADWDLLDRSSEPKPKRDMVATDGQKLTLGDTTLTMYITPGHTLGTISTLIPVKDNGQPHLVAEWGGTLYNWMRSRAAYITPERSDKFWFDTYIASARRFRDIAARARADAVISNHTIYDESKRKIPALAKRKAGDPHPYVVGTDAVRRYLTVAEECARANELRVAAR